MAWVSGGQETELDNDCGDTETELGEGIDNQGRPVEVCTALPPHCRHGEE
jgi:hypothetical protein